MLLCHKTNTGSKSRGVIEQTWAWLELEVRWLCLKVSVLSVSAAGKANDLVGANVSPADPSNTVYVLLIPECGRKRDSKGTLK